MGDKDFYDFARDFFGVKVNSKKVTYGHAEAAKRTCRKCGSANLRIRYIAASGPCMDKLACACSTCDFNWSESPLDRSP